jgi:hypothetical protein
MDTLRREIINSHNIYLELNRHILSLRAKNPRMVYMKSKNELIIAVLISILASMSPTNGISISVSGDAGGFEEDIQANVNDQFKESTILSADSLSNTLDGSGSIKKSFFSNPSSIGCAEVGFDIKNAESYSYNHYVDPYYVSVSDNLEVSNADKITAWASAHNYRGDSVSASTTVSGIRNGASLNGYSSSATVWQASNILAKANQRFEGASGEIIHTKEWAKNAEGDEASSRLSVIEGSLGRYSGGTYAGTDMYHYYEPEWFYESDQASISHGFQSQSATMIQAEESAKNAEGDAASSGISVKSGFVDSYYGVAYSGLTLTYGENSPTYKFEYSNAYNNIYGLSGAKIHANEKATDTRGDKANSQTDIANGSIYTYHGSADASHTKSGYLESQYASIWHGIDGLIGTKTKIDEKAVDAKGIFTSTSMSLRQGSMGSYLGNAAAGFSPGIDPWDGAFARSYSREISGKKLNLGALAIVPEGIMLHNSTTLKKPANVNYENRAEVNFSITSVYQGQM